MANIEKALPTLETERLVLRPFTLADAPQVQTLAGEKDIASTTANIPYPYPDGAAEEWIGKHAENFATGQAVELAITRQEDGALVGAIGLMLTPAEDRGEMGYWIGKPYWNQGYATEAGKSLLQYGFEVLGLNRIYARYLTRNPASGRVMSKMGMKYEGCLRQHMKKWGAYEDLAVKGMLRSEYFTAEDSKGTLAPEASEQEP